MDFNLVSKNNLGVVVALLLVVILSQAQFFNFLLDTALGRAILILFILFISYTNQILGVISVLFVIIMFNNSDIGYMEGFTSPTTATPTTATVTPSTSTTTPSTTTSTTTPTTTTPTPTTPTTTTPTTTPSTTTPTQFSIDANNIRAKIKNKITSKETGQEGFDILGSERNIQLGKRSNTIPSNKSTNGDSVMPFDSSFSNLFSAYK